MANGVTHTTLTAVSTAACFYASVQWVNAGMPDAGAGLAVGAVLGHFITPDIDHHHHTIEEKRIAKLFGKKAGRYWSAFWAPYEVLMKHGSWLSHVPVIGTGLRIIYVLLRLAQFIAPVILAFMLLDLYTVEQLSFHLTSLLTFSHNNTLRWLFFAWCMQDTIHWAADGFRIWI